MRRRTVNVLVAGFGLTLWVTSVRLLEYRKNSERQAEGFRQLSEQVRKERERLAKMAEKPKLEGEPCLLPEYADLVQENPDFWGWLRIEGTGVDYPVMYTPDDPEFYLRRDFWKEPSGGGVPFLDENCRADGGIFLIYGHNMQDGSMFAPLLSYAEEDFCVDHPTVELDTLWGSGCYTVMAAFFSRVYQREETGGFRYYQYTELQDEDTFRRYLEEVRGAALYDTGVTAEYGDQLLVLSTCSYHTEYGRFVVVARKKMGT